MSHITQCLVLFLAFISISGLFIVIAAGVHFDFPAPPLPRRKRFPSGQKLSGEIP